jgi:hypothetical protein
VHAIFVRVFIIVILIYSSVDRKAVVESKCKVGHVFPAVSAAFHLMFAKDSSLVLQLEGPEMELHSEPFPLSLRTTHIQDTVAVSSFPSNHPRGLGSGIKIVLLLTTTLNTDVTCPPYPSLADCFTRQRERL